MNTQVHKPSLIGGVLSLLLLGVLTFKDLPNTALLQRTVARENSRLSKGTAAPDFQLPTASGETLGLDNLKGAMSLLIFVTPTCPYCKQLKESLVAQGGPDLKNRLVFITAKTHSAQELPAEVQALEAKIVHLFPVLQDTAGSTAQAYKAQSVPTSYLLDKDGKVIDSGVGAPEGLKLAQKLMDQALVAQTEGCDSCQ